MKRVLITGASGFLGKAVIKLTSEQKDLEIFACISGRREVVFPNGVSVVKADLLDAVQLEQMLASVRPDVIMHFAWGLESKGFLSCVENIEWLEASVRLLRLFIIGGGKRFIMAGSSAEYGYEYCVCREIYHASPSDLYGETKLAFSKVALRLCEQSAASYVAARIFSVYGPGEVRQVHAIPVACSTLLSGNEFICQHPNNVWDFVYIDDVARALKDLIYSDFCGAVNIATGKPNTMRDVFSEIAGQLGCLNLLSFKNESAAGKTLISDASVMNSIGIRCDTSIQQGITQTLEFWKSEVIKQ